MGAHRELKNDSGAITRGLDPRVYLSCKQPVGRCVHALRGRHSGKVSHFFDRRTSHILNQR